MTQITEMFYRCIVVSRLKTILARVQLTAIFNKMTSYILVVRPNSDVMQIYPPLTKCSDHTAASCYSIYQKMATRGNLVTNTPTC